MGKDKKFEKKIEESSLGTPEAEELKRLGRETMAKVDEERKNT